MSAVTHGMDTAAGKQAGEGISTGSEEIRELSQRLDGVIMGFDWTGTDAERVRASWQEHERPALDATAQHLARLAVLLAGEAEAQDTASDSGAAAGSPAAAAPVPAPATGGGLLGWLDRHVGTFLTGLVRTGDQAADFLGKVDDVLTGEHDWPLATIAASALSTVGAGVGTVIGAVTGEDQHWFHEGQGIAGTPVATPTDPALATQYQPALTPPHDLPSLLQGVTDAYQVGSDPTSHGDIRITRVDNGGTPAYVVAIPGTETWSPAAGATGRDLTANLALVGGSPTAAAQSVELAMQQAGIPAGAPVLLVGHSQGGIIAATLASDPAFVERYGVTDVLTYGAPIDHLQIDPGVGVLQVQHGMDVVPRLDLGGVGAGGLPDGRETTVTLDSPGHFYEPALNHSYIEYTSSIRDELGADTDAGRILREYQSTLAPFFVGPGGSASAVDIPVSRGDRL